MNLRRKVSLHLLMSIIMETKKDTGKFEKIKKYGQYIYIYIYIYINTSPQTHIYVVNTHTHTYIYIYICIYRYTQA